MEEATKALRYPKGLPRDVWLYLVEFLDLRDIGRLARVCVAFNVILSSTNIKLLDKWFRELKAQCAGEEGREARELLDFCKNNIRNTSVLLSVLDKVLHHPNPHDPVPPLEDPIERTADALVRKVYADPRNNPRDTLRRALMSLIENNDHLIARAEVIVQRDKLFDQRISYLPKAGLGLMLVGLIVQFAYFGHPSLGRNVATPFLFSGFLMGATVFYKDTGIIDYYKHRGFWRKVNALPREELALLPHIKRISDGYNDEWDGLKFVSKVVAGATVGVMLLAWLLVQILLRNTNHSSHTLGPSGP